MRGSEDKILRRNSLGEPERTGFTGNEEHVQNSAGETCFLTRAQEAQLAHLGSHSFIHSTDVWVCLFVCFLLNLLGGTC